MLKTFKWIYELGFKHAEAKYYHALVSRANNIHPTQFEMFGIENKPEFTKEDLWKRQDDAQRLKHIIEDVFHPVEYITQEDPRRINRFEP